MRRSKKIMFAVCGLISLCSNGTPDAVAKNCDQINDQEAIDRTCESIDRDTDNMPLQKCGSRVDSSGGKSGSKTSGSSKGGGGDAASMDGGSSKGGGNAPSGKGGSTGNEMLDNISNPETDGSSIGGSKGGSKGGR